MTELQSLRKKLEDLRKHQRNMELIHNTMLENMKASHEHYMAGLFQKDSELCKAIHKQEKKFPSDKAGG